MSVATAEATGCIHEGCRNDGRYETEKGLVCSRHVPDSEPSPWNGCKVFAATKAADRKGLGEKVTEWLRAHPQYVIVDKIVTQSSDNTYHCITISVFYRD